MTHTNTLSHTLAHKHKPVENLIGLWMHPARSVKDCRLFVYTVFAQDVHMPLFIPFLSRFGLSCLHNVQKGPLILMLIVKLYGKSMGLCCHCTKILYTNLQAVKPFLFWFSYSVQRRTNKKKVYFAVVVKQVQVCKDGQCRLVSEPFVESHKAPYTSSVTTLSASNLFLCSQVYWL